MATDSAHLWSPAMYETGFPYVTSETVKRCPAGRASSTSAVHIKVEAAGRQQGSASASAPATAEDGWTPGCGGYRYPSLQQQTDSGQAAIVSEAPRSYAESSPTGANKSPEGNPPSGAKTGGPSVPAPSIGGTTPPMQQQQQQQQQQHQQHAAFGPFRDRYQSAFSNLTPLLCYEKTVGPVLPPEPVRPIRIPAEPEPVSSRGSDKSVVVPADPSLWSPEHVKQWLEWAVREYSLQDVDAGRFTFLGRELCHLSREDFSRLTNPYNGEVLYAHLHFLRQTSETSLPPAPPSAREKAVPPPPALHGPQPSTNGNKLYQMEATDSHPLKLTKSETTYKGAWSTSPSAQSQAYGPHNALSGMTKSGLDPHPHIRNMQDPYQVFGPTSSRLASSGSGQIQLWQFLLELLSDSSNANCITWEGTNGEFKLTDPDEVARRWGERKSKPNMNYDKNIMTKVHGKRYAYKFDFQGLAQATQPAAADPSAYKYQSDLFMPSYHHSPKLNFAAHAAGISSGGVFPSPSSYWSNPSANLYSNIASGHGMPHHAGHVAPHIGSYPHYA